MNLRFILAFTLVVLLSGFSAQELYAQKKKKKFGGGKSAEAAAPGKFSGDFQMAAKFFEPDSIRGAWNNPFYENQFYGSEGWLQLNYNYQGFDVGMRYDFFHNTNIFSPNRPYPAADDQGQGIGRWYIRKTIDKLTIQAGYFYDQFGSGLTLRAYEARALGIDQAVKGVRLAYKFNKDWNLVAFTGRQKFIFETYKPILKGANLEGYISVNDKLSLAPGVSIVNRTIDEGTMQGIAAEINTLDLEDRFDPRYNVYMASFYNRMSWGKIGWYVEGAYKTEDVIRDLQQNLIHPDYGMVGLTNVSYSTKGFGIILQAKYTENFDARTSPNETFFNGQLNYQPSLTRENSGRLTARYAAATQPLGELALQGDATFTPVKGLTFNLNYSDINTLEGGRLYREGYLEASYRPGGDKKWKTAWGVQMVDYNRFVFEQKQTPENPFVNTFTTFGEFIYKFDKKRSLKTEVSHMLTERNRRMFGSDDDVYQQDLGDWFYALAEFSIAPSYSFAVADLINLPNKDYQEKSPEKAIFGPVHYPTFFVSYTKKVSRFSLAYVKQPAGIVCTGGICRLEPAFSGVRFDLTTNF